MAISKIESASLASGVPTRAQLPAGTVLQVVSTFSSTSIINNSSTYADTGLAVVITPTSSASKFLVQATIPWAMGTNNGNGQLQFRLLRDATELTSNIVWNNVSAIVQLGGAQVLTWIDTPNTASAMTYKIQFREVSMANRYGNTAVMPVLAASQYGSMQVLEIAA